MKTLIPLEPLSDKVKFVITLKHLLSGLRTPCEADEHILLLETDVLAMDHPALEHPHPLENREADNTQLLEPQFMLLTHLMFHTVVFHTK